MSPRPFSTNLEAELREEERRRASGEDRLIALPDHRDALAKAVEEAKQAAYQEGYAKGEADAREAILAQCSATITEVAPKMQAILEQATEHRSHLERQLANFVYAIAERIAPDVLRQRSKPNVMASIRETMAMTLTQSKLDVTVSPAVQEAMGRDLEDVAVQLGFKGALQVAADPELADGEARVAWDDGFMEYSFERVCEQILVALDVAKTEPPST